MAKNEKSKVMRHSLAVAASTAAESGGGGGGGETNINWMLLALAVGFHAPGWIFPHPPTPAPLRGPPPARRTTKGMKGDAISESSAVTSP